MKPTPLTDEDIEACCKGASNYYESSRAIEAAVNQKWLDMLSKQEPDPTHPQYVAGFKAGRYAGLRRIESSPEDAPKPTIGSVKCPKCNTQFAAFQVQQPAQQETTK